MLVASWASAATAMRFLPMAHTALLPSPEGVPTDAAVGEEAAEPPLWEFMRRASCGGCCRGRGQGSKMTSAGGRPGSTGCERVL
jgi:hypothetical protein